MSTESLDPRFIDLDKWSSIDAVTAITEGQFTAVYAALAVKNDIAKAVDAAKLRLHNTNGRLIYCGAGTSGRVAVQDGVELHPTYGWPWERLVFFMAGGEAALIKAVEDAEDDYEAGAFAISNAGVNENDVIVGVAASGRTPYTLGAIHKANELGALTIGFANNNDTALINDANIGIFLDSGSEPVAGSTRMKAGTSQKIALNTFSTALMVALGGVYKGLMVGMKATNQKLRNRATKIIMQLTGTSEAISRAAVTEAHGDLKLAVLIALGIGAKHERQELLDLSHGNLRSALQYLLIDD